MPETVYHVLFICHENAGRSLMAEAMLNKMGQGRFLAFSAGIAPANEANPVAIQVLEREGFDTSRLRPKHVSVFLEDEAPPLDFVFTLCEDSEQEAKVSIWNELSNDTITAHWHFSDPHHNSGDASDNNDSDNHSNEKHSDSLTEQDRYSHVQRELAQRLRLFMSLPEDKLSKISHHPET
ncbi:MAG: hypothetical protein Q4P13_13260, partial [Psychrobacter sp.]|nr:hypothetical protein [Psychrobacter sp.]